MAGFWAVTGSSESGDHYGPFLFDHAPTDDEKKQLIMDECDWAEPDGPGDYGSFTYLTVSRVQLRTRPPGTSVPGAPASSASVSGTPAPKRSPKA